MTSIRIIVGDCREVMKTLPDASVDSVVCDPPYELTSKRPDGRSEATRGAVMGGFMGLKWDGTGVAFDVAMWAECLRVLKPGGYLLAFGGTRTQHRMVCAIEDAGFEIRDTCIWMYGTGFNKVGYIKNDDGTHVREGFGGSLKPAFEPIVMARKQVDGTIAENMVKHGTGALNIDACRVPVEDDTYARNFSGDRGHAGTRDEGETGATNMRMGGGTRRLIQSRPNEESDANRNAFSKGLAGSVAAGETSLGRWPANILHDGSPEVVALFPQSAGQQAFVGAKHGERPSINAFGDYGPRPDTPPRGDSGSAARFFWCPKASRSDRNDGLDKCACHNEAWAKEDRKAVTRAVTGTQARRATTESTKVADSEWLTSSRGSEPIADLFQMECRSTTETRTSRTTTPQTSNSSTPSRTSDCTRDANCEPRSGGSPAVSAASASPSEQITGISAAKDGPSTGDAGPATSESSSRKSGSDGRCASCGALTRSTHPTVKPTQLCRYLVRLVTPPGGTVLDPFMGSGSTLKAAELEGFNAIGIELSEDYAAIARRRIGYDAPLFSQVTE